MFRLYLYFDVYCTNHFVQFQEDDAQSDAQDVEVISISYDSDISFTRPPRRVCRKVHMTHLDAYLDPDILFKKAMYTPKCHTRSSSGDLMAGLPEKEAIVNAKMRYLSS